MEEKKLLEVVDIEIRIVDSLKDGIFMNKDTYKKLLKNNERPNN